MSKTKIITSVDDVKGEVPKSCAVTVKSYLSTSSLSIGFTSLISPVNVSTSNGRDAFQML